MLKGFRVLMKVDIVKVDEDDKVSGSALQDVMIYEKDFAKTIQWVVDEAIKALEKQ